MSTSKVARVVISTVLFFYSMVLVRERTIPPERPPLVGEVIANLCGERVPRGQLDGSLGRILGFLDSRYFSIK
jgi:hypothetical protein